MKSWFSRLIGAAAPDGGAQARSDGAVDAVGSGRRLSLPALPARTWAIGDVHGCLHLYRALEDRIVADARAEGDSAPGLIVVLGDIVDRGPHSAQLVEHLMGSPPAPFTRVVLKGNHEDMMVRFAQDPGGARNWLNFGGAETLQSYGLEPEPGAGFDLRAGKLRQMVTRNIPDEHLDFLRDLPLCLTAGGYLFSHAGLDPARPLEAQSARDFIWGNPRDLDHTPSDRFRVVHGHVPVEEVMVTSARVAVDTGAYATGRLSAVRLTPDGVRDGLEASSPGPGAPVTVDLLTLM